MNYNDWQKFGWLPVIMSIDLLGDHWWQFQRGKAFKPWDNQHLISPYSNISESFIKIMRTKEMIATWRVFDRSTNSPCQYWRKCIEQSVENVDTDVRV